MCNIIVIIISHRPDPNPPPLVQRKKGKDRARQPQGTSPEVHQLHQLALPEPRFPLMQAAQGACGEP